jgi:hypothetical protein
MRAFAMTFAVLAKRGAGRTYAVSELAEEMLKASQPTLSRFENAVTVADLKRLRDVFIDQFRASFATPPGH